MSTIAICCLFLGYSQTQKGYWCINIITHCVLLVRLSYFWGCSLLLQNILMDIICVPLTSRIQFLLNILLNLPYSLCVYMNVERRNQCLLNYLVPLMLPLLHITSSHVPSDLDLHVALWKSQCTKYPTTHYISTIHLNPIMKDLYTTLSSISILKR